MSDFSNSDSDNPNFDEQEKKEQEAAEAIKVDGSLYQFLTEEILDGYLPMVFPIGHLEGDFIEAFNEKADDKGITVKANYINQLWENNKPVPGVDLRSGEYGIEFASAGFFHAGCQFFDKGDKENALRNLEKAIELWPRHILARSLKSRIHSENGDLWLAAAEYGNAILLNPLSIAEKDSKSMRVLEEYSEGFDEVFGELLAADYYNRGTILHNLHRNEEALADLNEAIKRGLDNLDVISWRQTTYMALERWEDAIADADTLIVAGYNPEQKYQYRGISLRMMKRYWEAIEDFNAAIKLNPDLTYAYLQRAVCNFEEGLYGAAINDATIAIEKGLPYAHHFRGRAYYYTGELTKAIADFDMALKEDPDDEISQGLRERSFEYMEAGTGFGYNQQNEKGEWEQITKRNGKVESIIPLPDYQQELDQDRMEQAEENGWKVWNWEKGIREPVAGTGKER